MFLGILGHLFLRAVLVLLVVLAVLVALGLLVPTGALLVMLLYGRMAWEVDYRRENPYKPIFTFLVR